MKKCFWNNSSTRYHLSK